MDKSIHGCLERLCIINGIGNYGIGLFLSDIGFKERAYRHIQDTSKINYYRHLARDHVQEMLGMILNDYFKSDVGIFSLKDRFKLAKENVKTLKLKERRKSHDPAHLGSIILEILKSQGLTHGNFDEKSQELITLIGGFSLEIVRRDSNFRKEDSLSQYSSLVHYLPRQKFPTFGNKAQIQGLESENLINNNNS